MKSESCCYQDEDSYFDYRGIENILVENPKKEQENSNYFTPKRFNVIQMI